MNIISDSRLQTINFGARVARQLKKADIVCLFGQLGSGKTVLVKGIARGLGIDSKQITSPSFVLIREHPNKIPFYHFDLYRLKNPKDVFDLGYEEYLYGEGITVIEWADRLQYLLPKEYLKVELFIKSSIQRLIRLSAFGNRYKELLRSLKIIAGDL